MRRFLLVPSIIVILCCLAFAATYIAVHQAYGQSAPGDPTTTPDIPVTVTADPGLTATPEPAAAPDASPTAQAMTPVPESSADPFDELGDRAAAGSVFEKYGARLQIPEGLGDFRVLYPVIVDWGFAPDVDHPNIVMTVYNPQTQSSLFFRFEDSPEGPRPVEVGRKVENPQANAALDSIASTAEVAR